MLMKEATGLFVGDLAFGFFRGIFNLQKSKVKIKELNLVKNRNAVRQAEPLKFSLKAIDWSASVTPIKWYHS